MVIKVDKEGKEVIDNLCDIALRVGGLRNREEINKILAAIEVLKDEDGE